MYAPHQNGIAREQANSVIYTEVLSPEGSELVYCFWELKTEATLKNNFYYVVLPDTCVDIVFDLKCAEPVATIMTPHTESMVINLGDDFHFVGIRLLPGVYTADLSLIVGSAIDVSELADRAVADIVKHFIGKPFVEQQSELLQLVKKLAETSMLRANPLIARLIANAKTQSINSMAISMGISERQLRRVVRAATGFSPRELLKVVNFQKSFSMHWQELYADQSHYIHSFKQITHETPRQYERSYCVRNSQYKS